MVKGIIERNIDGFEFRATAIPPRRAAKLFRRIGSVFGPAFGKAISDAKIKDIGDLNSKSLGEALQVLFDRLSEPEYEHISDQLLSCVEMMGPNGAWAHLVKLEFNAGQPVDLLLAGRLGTMFKCIAFGFEVNFGNFFTEITAGLSRVMGTLSQFAVSNGSPKSGQSGDSLSNGSLP